MGLVKKQKPLPPIEFGEMSQAKIKAIFELEQIWTQANRNASKGSYRHSLFTSPTPWLSEDRKQRIRWRGFLRLDDHLTAHNIDPREFCVAVATKHAQMKNNRRMPNIKQATSQWYLKLYQEWRQQRVAEDNGDMGRVNGAATLGTMTPEQQIKANMKQAYDECVYNGADFAPTLEWGLDVIWVFWMTEPQTRPIINGMLIDLKTDNYAEWSAWKEAWYDLQQDISRQLYLMRLRKEAVPAPCGQLPSPEAWFAKNKVRWA